MNNKNTSLKEASSTNEEFRKNLESEFPMMVELRNHELKKMAHEIFNQSKIGKIVPVIYFIVSIGSIFFYRSFFNFGIILSIFLGIVTWFVILSTMDKLLIKISGIEKHVKQTNDREIESSLNNLRKTGVVK